MNTTKNPLSGWRDMRKLSKAEKCRNMMYKRSMLADINYMSILDDLQEMQEVCSDIHYAFDDDETLINAFDGNEDEAWEFKLSFSDLDYEVQRLVDNFEEMFRYKDDPDKEFNDMTVALLGEWSKILGFDSYREDYFDFDYAYSENVAFEESQKRVMRKTKKQILDDIGLTMSFVLRYFDLKTRYEYLKATIDIFREENTAVIKLIKSIDEKYKDLFDKADGELITYVKSNGNAIAEFDRMVNELPDKYWIE